MKKTLVCIICRTSLVLVNIVSNLLVGTQIEIEKGKTFSTETTTCRCIKET